MSTKQGKIRGHHFHGDPQRFSELADYIAQNYKHSLSLGLKHSLPLHGKGKIKTIADVAGGQGMLSRILNKKYNFESDVIDPRGFTLLGVTGKHEEYKSEMAEFYDLIVGLHPDEATREIVYSALKKPVIIIPCCNFWDREKKLGRDALLAEIEKFYTENGVQYKRIVFDFEGPKNIGLVSKPPIKIKDIKSYEH